MSFKNNLALCGLLAFTGISATGSFSQSADFYNNYLDGNGLMMEQKYDKALEKYNKAIAIFPIDYAYFNRGNAKLNLKDYKGALADYDKTISLNAEYATAFLQRGITKIQMGDQVNGCLDLKTARKLNSPGAADALKKYCK